MVKNRSNTRYTLIILKVTIQTSSRITPSEDCGSWVCRPELVSIPPQGEAQRKYNPNPANYLHKVALGLDCRGFF